ncbi:MAG: hypothetical protein K0S07_1136 [Chlamydiales bacterium]|jgi:hypothetical protein|nr:hypothetical protein [Chlamydiales bacterium]
MDFIKNNSDYIVSSIPFLTPAAKKVEGIWEGDKAAIQRRVYVVAIAAFALPAAMIGVGVAALPPVAMLGGVFLLWAPVAILGTWCYEHISLADGVCRKNAEEFCQHSTPPKALMEKMVDVFAAAKTFQQVIALKGDLNKEGAEGETLLDIAVEKNDHTDHTYQAVALLLEHGACRMSANRLMRFNLLKSLVKPIVYESPSRNGQPTTVNLLPKLLSTLTEEEIDAFKASPDRLEELLKDIFLMQGSLPIDSMAQILTKLRVTRADLNNSSILYFGYHALNDYLRKQAELLSNEPEADREEEMTLVRQISEDLSFEVDSL